MQPVNVLLDMLEHFGYVLHRVISDMPDEALQWQPDPEANNIAVTVWHISRALDLLKVKILENQPHQKQLWYEKGWADKTNYDPAGLGVAGLGNLAGYTLEQVKAVPHLSAEQSLVYFDQVGEALSAYLKSLPPDGLEQPPAGWPASLGSPGPECVYDVLMMFLLDNREHLGEIKAIKAMWNRKNGQGAQSV
ncbi:MAG: DinB family protein [Chloroflexota bacterium]